ncbi:hypothetical protein TNCV_4816001 [Trichonephila clavipes]|nr:hypothetical protein TNCV_4816001 [Trichonephila clavipes]
MCSPLIFTVKIVEVYGEEAMSRQHVAKWCRSFHSGRGMSKTANGRRDRPSSSTTETITARVEEMIQNISNGSLFPCFEVEEALIWQTTDIFIQC